MPPTEREFLQLINLEPGLSATGFYLPAFRSYVSLAMPLFDFEEDREALWGKFAEFVECLAWLKQCKLCTAFNKKSGHSSDLKQYVESRAHRSISNGAFIAAVFYLKIPYEASEQSESICLPIADDCPMLKTARSG